jgi:hypothetical protein
MREEDGEFVSDLIDVSDVGAAGVDLLSEAVLIKSLRRLIRETRVGLSEFSGFQNYLPRAASLPLRESDE